jgi:uncharacterized protein (DUF302 family)
VSRWSVADTVTRLAAVVDARKMKMFAVIDHSGEATNEGLGLRDTKLVIFGSPTAGTPVMVAAPLAVLDLPLNVLVWADNPRRRSATPRRVARSPLQAERRSDRKTRRDGRADGRRHQCVKPLSHSTTTSQAARARRWLGLTSSFPGGFHHPFWFFWSSLFCRPRWRPAFGRRHAGPGRAGRSVVLVVACLARRRAATRSRR